MEHTGLTVKSMDHAVTVGYFAAHHYCILRDLLIPMGHACPDGAFNFRQSAEIVSEKAQAPQTVTKGSGPSIEDAA